MSSRSVVMWAVGLLLICGCSGSGSEGYNLVLLQTNDTHSQILGFPNCAYDPSTTGDGTNGGAARYGARMDQIRLETANAAVETDILNLSAGDFTMGSMLVAAEKGAADLNLLKKLNFDAAGLGNHEFDWTAGGTAAMITNADQPPVPLLCADLHFSDTDSSDDTLAALYGTEGEAGKLVYPYIVRTMPSGLKVGVFGLIGIDAGSVSGASWLFPKNMTDLAADAQAAVDRLRNEEGVQFVILLGHLGLHVDGGTPSGETADLAQQVCGIDVILSGHYHSVVQQPVAIPCQDGAWSTWAMEAGSDGLYLGRWDLILDGHGRVHEAAGQLIPIDDQIVGLSAIDDWEQTLIADVQENVISKYPIAPADGAFLTGDYFQQLAQSDFDLVLHPNECNNLAYLLSDAMRAATGSQLAVVSNGGDVRKSLMRCNGGFCLADVFNAAPYGIGLDSMVGFPLVRFYLPLDQIKLVLEYTTAFQGLTNDDYVISPSGMNIEFDASQNSLARIQKITAYETLDESDANGGTVVFDSADGGFKVPETTLYSVTTSYYIALFLASF